MSETTHSAVERSTGPERGELLREATTMVLYVSVVEIAELTALPEDHFANGHVTGPVGGALLAALWGTALGLAIAHWFAFRIAAPAFRGENVTSTDTKIGLAQLGAAVFVAAVSSLPVLFLTPVQAQEFTSVVPALVIGVIGYLIARSTRKSKTASLFYGLTALSLGLLVALVKSLLAAH
jgi:hypothetical protein